MSVDEVAKAASAAAIPWEELGRAGRAERLERMAGALESDRSGIVETADAETRLGRERLDSELNRSCHQLRLFAEVIREGSYVEATIDHPGDTPAGPRPDLRRMLIPAGPVAVFGASNFPLAFSVPGGDTASALAAGCPVVVKAHPSHPETSRRCYAALQEALTGAPAGVVALVEGFDAGAELVQHPAIKAVGFTGSTAGGRALYDLAAARPDPIPFYGELGSLNPLVVTPGAAISRAADIAAGYIASMTLGVGQFCTKPGLLFLPAGPAGDPLQRALTDRIGRSGAGPMLNEAIHRTFVAGVAARRDDSRVTPLGRGAPDSVAERSGVPELLRVAAADLGDELLEECFGPTGLVVEYVRRH